MSPVVNTRTVEGRRKLRFEGLAGISADVEAMRTWNAGAKSLGNWSPGQNLAHVALTMTRSIDGFPAAYPWIVRVVFGGVVKRRVLRRPMAPGFKAPKRAGLAPAEVSFEEGLELMRVALGRLTSETRRAASPLFGKLSGAEWEQFHCRHAELHLSFVVPSVCQAVAQ